MNFVRLCNDILILEEKLRSITISDSYLIKIEIENELGQKYNELMCWVEKNEVEKIEMKRAYRR